MLGGLSCVGVWIFFLVVVTNVDASVSCEAYGNGTTFNLAPLTYDPNGVAPAGYSIADGYGDTFYINFCEEVSTVSYYDCSKNSPAASCQLSGGIYYSCGTVASTSFMYYQGLLTFVKQETRLIS